VEAQGFFSAMSRPVCRDVASKLSGHLSGRAGAAKSSWPRQLFTVVLMATACAAIASLLLASSVVRLPSRGSAVTTDGSTGSIALARSDASAGAAPHLDESSSSFSAMGLASEAPASERRVQATGPGVTAEEAEPTLDEVESPVFSRPPYSEQIRSMLVYYTVSGVYVLCALLLLVGANLDAVERRKRLARAIVPQEFVTHRFLCFSITRPQESVPCEITEQYYLDGRLLSLRSAEEVASRKTAMGFWSYLLDNASGYLDVLLREHLIVSFLPRAIPTFTRVKRASLIVIQVHVCMLVGAVALNIREHTSPVGTYQLFACTQDDCFPTVPAALVAAAIACPIFRFAIFQHVRITCFVSQAHPSTSRFPLGMRKFASLAPRSSIESLLCMRNGAERQKARVAQSRPAVHRAVHSLWQTTRSSIKDLRFYSPLFSWLMCLAMVGFVVGAAAYVLLLTVYLKDSVVYHWLVWLSVMLGSWILVLEPLLLFWTQVLWTSLVAAIAQRWGYGSHALAATSKYKGVVKEVDDVIFAGLRGVASVRIQHWWKGILNTNKQVNQQTSAASKMQSVRKKTTQKKSQLKERKWCMRVDVLDCADVEDVSGEEMNLFVRLKCDVGNTTVNDTSIAYNSGPSANFDQTFFVDIKESNSMHVEVCCKRLIMEDSAGRGSFNFNQLRNLEENTDFPDGHTVRIKLSKGGPAGAGFVNLRVRFLDPLQEQCGADGKEDWMMPKNRMKFALSKMGPGGKLKVGKMLGSLAPKSPASSSDLGSPKSPTKSRHTVATIQGPPTAKPDSSKNNASRASNVLPGEQYIADNDQLQAQSAGLAYRASKNLEDLLKPDQALLWGTLVTGMDEGDGWLRVGQDEEVMFLPMGLQGIKVLKRTDAGTSAPQEADPAASAVDGSAARAAAAAPAPAAPAPAEPAALAAVTETTAREGSAASAASPAQPDNSSSSVGADAAPDVAAPSSGDDHEQGQVEELSAPVSPSLAEMASDATPAHGPPPSAGLHAAAVDVPQESESSAKEVDPQLAASKAEWSKVQNEASSGTPGSVAGSVATSPGIVIGKSQVVGPPPPGTKKTGINLSTAGRIAGIVISKAHPAAHQGFSLNSTSTINAPAQASDAMQTFPGFVPEDPDEI